MTTKALRRGPVASPHENNPMAPAVAPMIASGCPCISSASATAATVTTPLRMARTFLLGISSRSLLVRAGFCFFQFLGWRAGRSLLSALDVGRHGVRHDLYRGAFGDFHLGDPVIHVH